MTGICILDTETLGLDPAAPIWEFAAITRDEDGHEDHAEFQIRHDPADWLYTLDEQFQDDYQARYSLTDAIDPNVAAYMIHLVTRGRVIIGCNPSFDLERIGQLFIDHGRTPAWHYRPLCVTTLAAGALHAAKDVYHGRPGFTDYTAELLALPWSSDRISKAIGVDPDDYPRHTAMGDVEWVAAQYDSIKGDRR